jgi:hypothetical protein
MSVFPPKEAKKLFSNGKFTYYEILVTPKVAHQFLQINEINRKIRNHHVMHLALQMQLERWIELPVDLILSEIGLLIDGQHRLKAIIESNKPQNMIFVTAKNYEEIFDVLDQGKTRTNADILDMDNPIVQPVQYLLRCVGVTKPVPADIKEVMGTHLMTAAEYIQNEIKPKSRWVKSAPFRAAFCVSTAIGANFTKASEAYDALGNVKVQNYTPLMSDMLAQFQDGFQNQSGRSLENEYFMRGMFMFLNLNKTTFKCRITKGFKEKIVLQTNEIVKEWRTGNVA